MGEVGGFHDPIRREWVKSVEKTHVPAMGLNYGVKWEGFLRIQKEGGKLK